MAANSRFAVSPPILAFQAGRAVPSAEIAARVGTHPAAIGRLLSALARGGLGRARQGVAGGFTLARPPGQLPLLAVHRAVEPQPENGLAHLDPNPGCPVGPRIGSLQRQIFEGAQAGRERELARTTPADLHRGPGPACPSERKP